MEPVFSRRDDAVINIDLGDSLPWLTEALLDAVSSRAPRGQDGDDPSTYWIDRTLASLVPAEASGKATVVASGNAWDLEVEGGMVFARSQYAESDEPAESIGVDEFRELLTRWREEVVGDRERGRAG